MDNRPIGIFDSGMGGLTAVRELSRLLPGEDIIYFGDTGRVPYGGRSRDTIIKYARQDVAFLRSFDLKAVVIACGTVSTTALDILAAEHPDLPVLGVVEPAARAAAEHSKNGRVGLIGTAATIRSGQYERQIATLRPDARVFAKSCPLFVPLVENGRFRVGDTVVETVVAEYLEELKRAEVDTLVLGCTHYPLLKEVIGQYMGQSVFLIDTGLRCAQAVARRLVELDGLSDRAVGRRQYFASDSAADFAALASIFLGEDIAGEVGHVEIDRY